MIFDGFDFSPFLRCNPSRRVMAPVSAASAQVPGRDGELAGEVRLGVLSIGVTARVVSDVPGHIGFSELRRALAGRLFRREPSWLVLDDDPSVRYRALLVEATEPSGWWQGATVELSFSCHDPVGYGARRSLRLKEGTSAVDVGGTYPALPAFEVDAAAGAVVVVSDSASGCHVAVPAAASARKVVVDCAARTATAGGARSPVTLQSRFFGLAPGRHDITVSGGACRLVYDERWI